MTQMHVSLTLKLHAPPCDKISLVNIANSGQTSNFPVTGIPLILTLYKGGVGCIIDRDSPYSSTIGGTTLLRPTGTHPTG